MKLKTKSRSLSLHEKYGGKWKYCRKQGQWNCDDGIRYVCDVLTGKDFDGEYTGESSLCMYFKDGSTPKWIYT